LVLENAPFEIYRPASSSVGMYQMTMEPLRKRRITASTITLWRRPVLGTTGNRAGSTVFTFSRDPSHAVNSPLHTLTCTLPARFARHRIATASMREKEHLAAVIHLCGAGAGDLYVRLGFHSRRREMRRS